MTIPKVNCCWNIPGAWENYNYVYMVKWPKIACSKLFVSQNRHVIDSSFSLWNTEFPEWWLNCVHGIIENSCSEWNQYFKYKNNRGIVSFHTFWISLLSNLYHSIRCLFIKLLRKTIIHTFDLMLLENILAELYTLHLINITWQDLKIFLIFIRYIWSNSCPSKEKQRE